MYGDCDPGKIPARIRRSPSATRRATGEAVQALVRETYAAGKHVAAICAAPALACSHKGRMKRGRVC